LYASEEEKVLIDDNGVLTITPINGESPAKKEAEEEAEAEEAEEEKTE
jgi:hypothetical protein